MKDVFITNTQTKTTSLSQALLWFGAAVSIAEILTGAIIAPLGLANGTLAILLGHIIGCAIFYFTGLIGAKSKLPAIESTRISFGKYGSYMFSVLNILQLLGWTAVMIISGSKALSAITTQSFGFTNEALWCVLIGALISIWILIGVKNLTKINIFAIGSLLVCSIILCFTVFSGAPIATSGLEDSMSFGAAVELSAIMPLSWLPLISDYTKDVKSEKLGTLFSTGGYFIGSCLMYIIGLGAAIYTGTSDIASILLAAGFSTVALLIVILSTVTTTFLDAYSAGISFININKKANEKVAGLVVCALGVAIAIFTPIEQYQDFLYLIGSVFAPLFAILLTDYFVFKITKVNEKQAINIKNIIIWAIGVFIYRSLMTFDSPIGTTLPVMIIISVLCIIINGGIKLCSKKS